MTVENVHTTRSKIKQVISKYEFHSPHVDQTRWLFNFLPKESWFFSQSLPNEHTGAHHSSSQTLPTLFFVIKLNTEINNFDMLPSAPLCDMKYDSEVLLKWQSTVISHCLEAKSTHYQS